MIGWVCGPGVRGVSSGHRGIGGFVEWSKFGGDVFSEVAVFVR